MMSQREIDTAMERGRQMAARKMAEDAEARRRVEDVYGVEYCRRRYPEAYRGNLVRVVEKYLLFE
jgi:hypothetical protein